jgi:hypothetical protein
VAVALLGAGITFGTLGHVEPAAVLFGKGDAMSARQSLGDDFLGRCTETDATLLTALGEQRLATLTRRGAALELNEAVAYLRAQAEPVLKAEPTA